MAGSRIKGIKVEIGGNTTNQFPQPICQKHLRLFEVHPTAQGKEHTGTPLERIAAKCVGYIDLEYGGKGYDQSCCRQRQHHVCQDQVAPYDTDTSFSEHRV